VARFIRGNTFRGVKGAEAVDELKVLAAAGAVMLLFGRTDRRFPRIAEILFTPDQPEHDVEGITHAYGAVVLSIPALRRAFAADDGDHVGLHEFAHVLDLSGQSWDGLPTDMSASMARAWLDVMKEEMKKAADGRGVLRPYAGTHEAEFFAVAVESFFERPEALYKANRALYEILEAYFGRRT
jgi:Mlc titration factor MtfA (ptsG expression regulator)